MSSNGNLNAAGALQKPVRNRYFHGKKLDVRHFELEQDYLNNKRWLLNRLVSGFGVVCGLDVIGCDNDHPDTVIVTQGLAIDKWGREIIVVQDSQPVKVARAKAGDTQPGQENSIHICLEYLECEADPAPVLASECENGQRCMPDTIQERYAVKVVPGKAPVIGRRCQIPDLTDNTSGEIVYDIMARWITESCPVRAADPRIPLAEIEFDEQGHCINLDITVRPMVYTNDLLFEMILAITERRLPPRPGGKY